MFISRRQGSSPPSPPSAPSASIRSRAGRPATHSPPPRSPAPSAAASIDANSRSGKNDPGSVRHLRGYTPLRMHPLVGQRQHDAFVDVLRKLHAVLARQHPHHLAVVFVHLVGEFHHQLPLEIQWAHGSPPGIRCAFDDDMARDPDIERELLLPKRSAPGRTSHRPSPISVLSKASNNALSTSKAEVVTTVFQPTFQAIEYR